MRFSKPILFITCLLPLLWIAISTGQAVNPIEFLTRQTGTWALNFLMITLCVTPLRRLTGYGKLLLYRRMLGLYVFFYAFIHAVTFFVFDHGLDPAAILHDVIKRPFVTIGFLAFILLIPLAATSNQAAIKKLKRQWQALHKLVYLIASLGVLHYFWLVKKDLTTPLIYAGILAILFLMRTPFARRFDKAKLQKNT
ncbi:protein-methionine-sulfoxide reductase heme-binding subunit MsrQ [Iodobacter fluviatilis]|uniref:Protein-methionine-sulfoxide reductase heme-binding subunit MsrQ n=1 Tax=Iodobacter fluviatilis TaxID=537 RepID=A0A7G3G863_9NEIS|nr:protein-methionine-sulfoxide reductase heme-binding subunit MsrQ [Iodobacter fluviatilis]QBC43354.1 sulfoxide reductase heme-binding subunit YedZ [Iodobacter fluviatilis]